MSSVLKALKEQSSPYIKRSSEVRLSSAKATSRGVGRIVIGGVLTMLAALAGWFVVTWLPALMVPSELNSSPKTVEHTVAVNDSQPSYQLGDMAVIMTPQWPQQDIPQRDSETTEPTVLNAQSGSTTQTATPTQTTQRPVTENKAIDLNQISPELLSAFENALAEDSQRTGAQQTTSVVPELTQLSYDFQTSIPSFTYDGHQYSSRAASRWIELSGVRLFEGERFQGMTVLTIAPAHVVLVKNSQAFQQPALEDWTNP